MDTSAIETCIRDVLLASDDASRDAASVRLWALPAVLAGISVLLYSPDVGRRALALQIAVRISPPPDELVSAVAHCLMNPLGDDPLGDESVLIVTACAAYADSLLGYRRALAERVEAIDRAEGPRAAIVRRFAHETLAKIDEALARSKRVWQAMIDSIAALIASGDFDAAATRVPVEAGEADNEHGCAQIWDAVGEKRLLAGDHDGAQRCFELALDQYRRHASYATSGGEGMERMLDVDRLKAKLAGLARPLA